MPFELKITGGDDTREGRDGPGLSADVTIAPDPLPVTAGEKQKQEQT
jgi:hypothetical protein